MQKPQLDHEIGAGFFGRFLIDADACVAKKAVTRLREANHIPFRKRDYPDVFGFAQSAEADGQASDHALQPISSGFVQTDEPEQMQRFNTDRPLREAELAGLAK